MIRWYGRYRGLREWLKTRFKPMSKGGPWMPGLWAECECKTKDLSPDFWQATKPHRADFENLGFKQCRLRKPPTTLQPFIHESGSIFYLDPTRCYFGQLLRVNGYDSAKGIGINKITIAFTAVYEDGSVSCTNNKRTFDPVDPGTIIRLNSYNVTEIYQRFQEELKRRRDTPRAFPDIESLRQWFDTRQIKNFKDWVERRLFIQMTESEIAAARAALSAPPSPRSGLKLKLWPTVLIFALVLLFLNRYSNARPADNTVEYHGQRFKMRLPYASYEDYKDDPNNLDTNELGRIEQTMEAVKIPTMFSDQRAFSGAMFDLKFPGYGLAFLDASTTTDDGSAIEAASVEIPERNKERVIVACGPVGGTLRLVDDFIFEDGGTNDIQRVRLERGQLEYFDQTGRLFREKRI